MRKIYTAITMTLFALSSFANQGISTEFVSSSGQAQVSETLGTDFLEFTITDQVTSTINAVDHTVLVTMPGGTDLTALVADFTLSTGATAWVAGNQVSSTVTALDYSTALTYTIKNGTESQDWVVTVVPSTVNVTFNVTIGDCAGDKTVYLVGGFIFNDGNWPEPGSAESIIMSDDDGDGTYTVVVEIAANTDDRYKYFIGEGWTGGDLTDGGCLNGDHCLVLGTEDVTFNDAFLCVGIIEDALSLVSMYPNPVSSQLTIANLEGVNRVVVSNLLGQALVTKNVTNATMEINTAEFKAGIYVVTLVSESGLTRSERIVKE